MKKEFTGPRSDTGWETLIYIASNGRAVVGKELEMTYKIVMLACSKLLSAHFPVESEENHKNLSQGSQCCYPLSTLIIP